MNPKKPRPHCTRCGTVVKRLKARLCSIECKVSASYERYIRSWQSGEIAGHDDDGTVRGFVKRFLREKYGNACTLCRWSKVNPHTGVVPLNADHIDGDWKNSTEQNLRLLCGCCDSLTSTYCGQNKGRGRHRHRKARKLALEAQLEIAKAASLSIESD